MSVTVEEQEIQELAVEGTSARIIWIIGVQMLALAVFGVLLAWAGGSYDTLPALESGRVWPQVWQQALTFLVQPHLQGGLPRVHLQLLAVLAMLLLVVSLVPALRRGPVCGILCGITLAVACSLAAGVTFNLGDADDLRYTLSSIPVAAPVMLAVALLAALWGLLSRARLVGSARFGLAAFAAAGLLLVLFLGLVILINRTAPFTALYKPIKVTPIAELLSALLLYPAALWLGSTGLRPAIGVRFLPFGLAAAIGLYFVISYHH